MFRCDVTRETDQYYFYFVVIHEKQVLLTYFCRYENLMLAFSRIVFKPEQSLKPVRTKYICYALSVHTSHGDPDLLIEVTVASEL